MKKEQLKNEIKKGNLTITDVVDAVIELNGIVGVGLITLGEDLDTYCRGKITTNKEAWQ